MSLVVLPSPGRPFVCRTEGPGDGAGSSPGRGTAGTGPVWDRHTAVSDRHRSSRLRPPCWHHRFCVLMIDFNEKRKKGEAALKHEMLHA